MSSFKSSSQFSLRVYFPAHTHTSLIMNNTRSFVAEAKSRSKRETIDQTYKRLKQAMVLHSMLKKIINDQSKGEHQNQIISAFHSIAS